MNNMYKLFLELREYTMKQKNRNLITQKLKKWVLISLLFMALPSGLWATLTRASGMGLDNDTAWMLDKQLPYIFENPAAMRGYENSIYFEYYNTVQMGGIFIPLNPKMTLGLFSGTTVEYDVFNSSEFQSLFHPGSGDPAEIDFSAVTSDAVYRALAKEINDSTKNPLENRNLEALFSYDMGKIKLGGGLSYGFASKNQSEEVTTTANDNTTKEEVGLFKSEFSLRFGAIYGLGGTFKTVGGSLFLTRYSVDNFYRYTQSNNTTEREAALRSSGSFDLGLNSRGEITDSVKSSYYIHFGYALLNRSTRTTRSGFGTANPDVESNYARKGHRLRFGASNERTLSPRLMIFWGSEIFYEIFSNNYEAPDVADSDPYKVSVYKLRLPLILGLRGNLTENTDVRFGVRHNVLNSGDNSTSTEETYNGGTLQSSTVTSKSSFLSAGSSLSMGLAYRINSLRFDWLANVAIFKDGPHFISGISNPWSTAFSVTFHFGDLVK